MKSRLFCFDFDQTITCHHLFTLTAQKMNLGLNREEACIHSIQQMRDGGIRNSTRLWELIIRLLSKNQGLAITSFTSFPELPLAFLNEGIRLARKAACSRDQIQWLSRGCIVYGDPAPHLCPQRPPPHCFHIPRHQGGDGTQGKNPHLQKAHKWAHQSRNRLFDECVLIDDDQRNVDLAIQAGHHGIWVPPQLKDESYLDELELVIHDSI